MPPHAERNTPDHAHKSQDRSIRLPASSCTTTICRSPSRGVDGLRSHPRASRGRSMQDPASELPRISLPRTWVNSPFALLGAAPLHAVHHLLGLWRELIEHIERRGIPNHHRIAFHVLQDDDPTLSTFREVSDSIASALINDVQAVRATITVGVLGQVIDEHFELLALDSSYRGRLRFGGLQVGVALQPPDQVFGGLL